MMRHARTKLASRRTAAISRAQLHAMIEEATVDAYGKSEQATGWHAMLEQHLALPFETTLLGVPATVQRIELTARDQIVAVCARGRHRQRVSVLDLALPKPRPAGAEWIEAYRH